LRVAEDAVVGAVFDNEVEELALGFDDVVGVEEVVVFPEAGGGEGVGVDGPALCEWY
jgi:hypothetical protein